MTFKGTSRVTSCLQHNDENCAHGYLDDTSQTAHAYTTSAPAHAKALVEAHAQFNTQPCTHTRTHTHTHAYERTQPHAHTHTHTHMNAHAHTRIQTHTTTCTHTKHTTHQCASDVPDLVVEACGDDPGGVQQVKLP
jgi:hypothetical protein